MQCSICTLPATQACGNLCGIVYCGLNCAQADWQNRHDLLCIGGQTKRQREEPTNEPSLDELIITIKTLRLLIANANNEPLLTRLEYKLLDMMNAENGQSIILALQGSWTTETMLLFTSRNGNIEGLQYLLSIGTDVNAKSTDGFSALAIAAVNSNTKKDEDIVALLLNQPNIDVNSVDIKGYTPLMLACQNNANKSTENIVRMLLKHPKIDVNLQDRKHGRTALMIALISAEFEKPTEQIVLMLTRHPDTDFFIKSHRGGIASDMTNNVKFKLMVFSAIAMQMFLNPSGTRKILNRDMSTNISLRRIRDHVCASLSDNGNLNDLKAFAQMLKFPYVEGVNKRDLCLALSDVLALGNVYDQDKQQQYSDRRQMRIQQMRGALALSTVDSFKRAAEEYVGIDTTGKTLDQIVQEVNVLLG